MSEERVGDPNATKLDKLIERSLRKVIPYTRWLALTDSRPRSLGRRWRLHIFISNAWNRSLDRITKGIWS